MNEFQIALLIGAAVTALICIKDLRALLWIGIGAASFVVSTWYARAGGPFPEAITALCDAAICFLLYFVARERWEIYLFTLFQTSVLVSTCYLAGVIGPHWAYIAALEGINWLALLVIGGTTALSWARNAYGHRGGLVDHLRGADRSLHAHVHTPFRES